MSDRPDGAFGDELKDGDLDMVCGGLAAAGNALNGIGTVYCTIRTSCSFASSTCAPNTCGHAGPSNGGFR
ncbi:MAG TPA: hypothetical protein PKM88_05650 [bacterium]|nr:hypothetical protein [bacterium]